MDRCGTRIRRKELQEHFNTTRTSCNKVNKSGNMKKNRKLKKNVKKIGGWPLVMVKVCEAIYTLTLALINYDETASYTKKEGKGRWKGKRKGEKKGRNGWS